MALRPTEVERYLARIAYSGSVEPAATTLARLQEAHLLTVPFENLHVQRGLGVRVDIDWSYPKVVEERRGGWCFELNGVFAALLESLGFDVVRRSASVFDPATGELGPPLDHLCLDVGVPGSPARWLVDVGFGDAALHPVPIPVSSTPTESFGRPPGRAEIVSGSLCYLDLVDGGWHVQYVVGPDAHAQEDFSDRSTALSTPPGYFTEKPFATRALDVDGSRVWLLRDRLKLRSSTGEVTETPMAPESWESTLESWFAMSLPR